MAIDLNKMQNYPQLLKQMNEFRDRAADYRPFKGTMNEVMEKLHPRKLRLKVMDIIQETKSTKTFRLAAPDRDLPPFLPGQYITVYVEANNIRTARAYSLSSAPAASGHYDITIRRVEGGLVSNFMLEQVKAGDTVETSSPSGNFYQNYIVHDSSVVFLAGGSGITPFMSMIRQETAKPTGKTMYLLYGNHSAADMIFNDELTGLARGNPHFKYIPVIEKPGTGFTGKTGYLSAELVKESIGDTKGKTFFLCGPGAMYDFCIPELDRLGVPRRKTRREVFGAMPDISRHHDWPRDVKPTAEFSIRIKNGNVIKAKAGDSLITTFEKNGLTVPSLCRSGECSLCRIRLLSGKVFQPRESLVRYSDQRSGNIHSCMSYPLMDLEIMI